MAKRTRKRRPRAPGGGPVQPRPRPQPAEPVARRTARDERPPAPWGSFPLVELVVLLALVLFAAGLFVQGRRGLVMIGAGLALGSLAGLELSIREHLAGYRSHTLMLAGAVAVVTLVALYAFAPAGLAPSLRLAIAAAVFAAAFWALRGLFKRRSGGLSFRIGGLSG